MNWKYARIYRDDGIQSDCSKQCYNIFFCVDVVVVDAVVVVVVGGENCVLVSKIVNVFYMKSA